MRQVKILFLLFFLLPFSAWGGDTDLSGFNLQTYHLSPDGTGVLSVIGSRPLGHKKWHLQIDTHFEKGLLKATDPQTNRIVTAVDKFWVADAVLAIGLWQHTNAGIIFPFYLFADGRDVNRGEYQTTGLGDMAFWGKWNFWKYAALQLKVTAPTGEKEKFTGQGSPTVSLLGILDKQWDDFYISTNVGYKFINRHQVKNQLTGLVWNVTDDDRLLFASGAKYRLPWQNRSWSIEGELTGDRVLKNASTLTTPVQFHMATTKRLSSNMELLFGAGRGLTSAVGSPSYRILFGVKYDLSNVRRVKPQVKPTEKAKTEVPLHTVFFKLNHSSLSVKQKYLLEPVLDRLRITSPSEIILNGYADAWGDTEYSRTLAQKRAETVKFFLQKNGIAVPIKIQEIMVLEKPITIENLEKQPQYRKAEMFAF